MPQKRKKGMQRKREKERKINYSNFIQFSLIFPFIHITKRKKHTNTTKISKLKNQNSTSIIELNYIMHRFVRLN